MKSDPSVGGNDPFAANPRRICEACHQSFVRIVCFSFCFVDACVFFCSVFPRIGRHPGWPYKHGGLDGIFLSCWVFRIRATLGHRGSSYQGERGEVCGSSPAVNESTRAYFNQSWRGMPEQLPIRRLLWCVRPLPPCDYAAVCATTKAYLDSIEIDKEVVERGTFRLGAGVYI